MLRHSCLQVKGFSQWPQVTSPLRANPELLSFSANLRQHLTELTMWMDNSKGIPRRLGALGKLTKLQSLVVTCDEEDIESGLFHDLSGQRLVFKLPELTSLHLEGLWHGEVVFSRAPGWLRRDFRISILCA